MNKQIKRHSKTVPDGGFGWVIVFAFGLYYFALSPSFGLMYRYKIIELQLTATKLAIIQNVGSVLGMLLGIFGGVLIKRYGCRTTAFVACTLIVPGILWSAFVKSFPAFIVSFGLLQSIGWIFGCMSVLNLMVSYFDKNRNKASGIAMTLSAIGPIVTPPLIEILQKTYDPDGCLLILAGLGMNIFVAAALLQPVKWHMKSIPVDADKQQNSLNTEDLSMIEMNKQICQEDEDEVEDVNRKKNTAANMPVDEQSFLKKVSDWMVENFDLTLLHSRTFVICALGVSLIDFSDMNFSLITTYILDELKYSTVEVAALMSSIAFADTISRFISPFIGDYFNQSPRMMFWYSGVIFIISRIGIQLSFGFVYTLFACCILGIGKGIMFTYWNLVVPSVVSIERLPSAIGIIMLSNGLGLMIFGPFVGIIRDYTGNYTISVIMLNVATFLGLLLWTIEMIWNHFLIKPKQ